jgi:hypothetical protein
MSSCWNALEKVNSCPRFRDAGHDTPHEATPHKTAPRRSPGGRRWSSRKPSSVSSRRRADAASGRWSSVWDGRCRPPLAAYPRLSPRPRGLGLGAGRTSPPIWPCSDRGLPCRRCYQRRGGLLPHRFTLTHLPWAVGGLLSVALSVAFRRPGVTWQSALWSSDFPRGGLATAPRPSRSASVHKSNRENGLQLPAGPFQPAAQASPSRARPCSAWRMNGLSAESAAFHWARASWYSCRASARRPSCS